MNRNESRALREERAGIAHQMSELATGGLKTPEDRTKFNALDEAQKLLGERIQGIERAESLETEMRGTGAPPAGALGGDADETAALEREEKDYRAAFRSYLKYGYNARPNLRIRGITLGDQMILQKRARQESPFTQEEMAREMRVVAGGSGIVSGSGASGTGLGGAYPGATAGFFVPVGFVDEIEQAMKYYGPMLNGTPGLPTIMPTDSGAPLPFPTSNDVTVVGEQVDEQATAAQGVIGMSNIMFGAYKFSSRLIQVSIELLQDSAFNIEEWLKARFAERLGRILNTKFTTGNGTNTPTGIATAAFQGPTFAGAYANDGASAANSIGSDDLVSLEHAVDIVYRRGARFMFHDQTIAGLKKLKDRYGRPLWLPSLAVNTPDTINGYPYDANNDLDQFQTISSSPAVTRKTALFGQMSKYLVRRVKDIAILRLEERFAEFGQVGFLAFCRYDGNLLDAGTHPVVYGQNVY